MPRDRSTDLALYNTDRKKPPSRQIHFFLHYIWVGQKSYLFILLRQLNLNRVSLFGDFESDHVTDHETLVTGARHTTDLMNAAIILLAHLS